MMETLAPGSDVNPSTSPGSCSDGLNTAGLSVSGLMQPASTGINEYKGTGAAIEQLDFINYALAMYDDVSGIKADLLSGAINLVVNPTLSVITKQMFNSSYVTMHYVIYDRNNQSLVIEYR